MGANNRSMLEGKLFPSIVSYTVPIILTSLLQLLFNAADLIVVGQNCGSVSVGAVGATGSLTSLLINLFIGFSTGVSVTVAHALGSGENNAVHNTVHTAVPIALISGVILTLIGVFFSDDLLRLMGTPDNVLPLSTLYMQIYFGGITFNMIYNFCAAILRAAGDTKSPLIFLAIAGVINVAANLLFVIVFHMDVAGVALATTISQGISAVLVVIALMRRTDACKLDLKKLRIHKAQMQKIIRIGLPAGIQGSLFAISNVIIQSSVNSFGDVFMSGNAASGNIEGFVYVSINAFHQTAVNFAGQNAGAGRYDRIRQTFVICILCVIVVGITMGSLAYIFGRQLLSIYITDSPQAIEDGMIRMAYIALPYFLCGMMDVATGILRGLGSSFIPMIISILGVCVFRIGWIMTVFQIPKYHTPQCLFLSYPLSWVITFGCEWIAYILISRNIRRRMDRAKTLAT